MEWCSLLCKEKDMTDMIYTDSQGTEIQKGSIVQFQNPDRPKHFKRGRITRITSKWVNIGGVWGGKVFAKKVPLTEITECADAFYKAWRSSESYRCM